MQSLWQDVRYGWRGLRGNPGFTALAVLTLGLGVGAGTTMFSVIKNVLIDPFPYKDPGRIVAFAIHNTENSRPGGRSFFLANQFLEFQEQSHVFSDVIGGGNEDVLYTTRDGTELFQGGYLTPNTFDFLGMGALLGRTLLPEDAKSGAPPVFLMSYKLWQTRFSADPSILGKTFTLNGVPTTLIGIMGPRFTKRGADVWRLAAFDRTNKDDYFMFQARMKPGVTLKQVAADIQPIAERLAKIYPQEFPKRFNIQVDSYVDSLVGPFRQLLYTLAAAVGLLLLIACGNVANMLLARSTARDREIAIRAALGASAWRVVRQLLIESLILSLGGAALGALLAWGGIKALVNFIPVGTIPQEAVISLDVPVLIFSLALAIGTSLLFGLAPALQLARRNLVEPLKDSGRGVSGGFRRGRLRNSLVVVELALSVVLLTGAGLLMRTFVSLQQQDLGFNPHNILVARLPFPKGQYKTAVEKQQFYTKLLARLHALPGVMAATETTSLPPYGGIGTEIDIPGKTHSDRWDAQCGLVSEGYMRTLGIRLQRGRNLDENDVTGARKMAVVNQTLVRKYFGNEDPIGRQIRLKLFDRIPNSDVTNPMFEIVGVFSDVKNRGLQEPPGPELYIPYTVTGAFERGVLVRTSGPPLPFLNAVRRETWAVDRNVALTETRTIDDFLSDFSYAQPRFTLLVLGVFAGIGLALVAIGVYSVIAYTVSRQTHEIGIRMALGAGRPHVLGMVFRMGGLLIVVGAAIGVGVSLAVTRVIQSQLWNVSAHDPLTFVGVTVTIAIFGVAACWFPAMRATRIDPTIALRFE
ncbi:MAG TPA: ABC transporter permease [Bryobacteraceae bacterium]